MRAALGVETLLVELRREMTDRMQSMPPPVGFRPRGRAGNSRRASQQGVNPVAGAANRAMGRNGSAPPAAFIDRLLHHCHIVNIRGNSYRMRGHQDLLKAAGPDQNAQQGSAA